MVHLSKEGDLLTPDHFTKFYLRNNIFTFLFLATAVETLQNLATIDLIAGFLTVNLEISNLS